MTSLQASIANPIALSSAIANYNYLWPSYSLPWNNFFRKISPTPYYVANEISNIEYRELKSPLNFDANPQGYAFTPTSTTPDLGCILPTDGSTTVLANASKTFQGTSYDLKSQKAGLTYQYYYTGQIVSLTNFTNVTQPTTPPSTISWILLGLNLAVPPTFAVSIQTKYVASTINGCSGAPCQLGNSCRVALTGKITAIYDNSPVTYEEEIIKPTPYLNGSVGCSIASSNSHYTIVGNRLYVLVNFTQQQQPINAPDGLIYAITVRTVESSVVADPALAPAIFV